LQRLEQQLEWLDSDIDGGLKRYLSAEEHPLSEFYELHSGDGHNSKPSMELGVRSYSGAIKQ